MVLTFVRRSTSPVRYESAPVLAEDIICPGSEEEEDSDGSGHRKRRRIEALATQYLQGRGLLIQTASLRGPFDRGWKNPWAKKRPRYPAGDIRRFPEANRKPHAVADAKAREVEPVSLKRKGILDQDETSLGANVEHNPQTETAVNSFQQPTTENTGLDHRPEGPPAIGDARSRNHASWLRQKSFEISPKEDNADLGSTPTPVTTGTWRAGTKDQPINTTEKEEGQVVNQLPPYVSSFIIDQASSKNATKVSTRSPKPSLRTAPPSTNLPEFRYRHAKAGSNLENKASQRPSERQRAASSSSSGSSAFAEALEAAQAKASSGGDYSSSYTPSPSFQQQANLQGRRTGNPKKLSFTASGSVKISGANTISNRVAKQGLAASGKERKQDSSTASAGVSLEGDMARHSKENGAIAQVYSNSSRTSNLPEAQIVPSAPALPVPSGYSTNPLETDRQSSKQLDTEEGDSILKMSTQAAVSRAQRSFQGALNDAANLPTASSRRAAHQEIDQAQQDDPLIRTVDPELRNLKPEPKDEALPNTQAMLASFSPFTVTTVKKRPPSLKKRTSFAISPTKTRRERQSPVPSPSSNPLQNTINKPEDASPLTYRKNSLSMSTSSTTSPVRHKGTTDDAPPPPTSTKPTTNTKQPAPVSSSNRTSFSILPNGTFSETTDLSNPENHKNDNQTAAAAVALQDGQDQPHQPPPAPSSGWPDLETDWAATADPDTNHADASFPSDPFRLLINARSNGTVSEPSQSQSEQPRQHRAKGRASLTAIGGGGGGGGFLSSSDGNRHASSGFGLPGSDQCDVDAVVEEAGKFLSEWHVEREAKAARSPHAARARAGAAPKGVLASSAGGRSLT